ncbi:MAG: hypothetical protein ACREUX_12335 [Burkholderiales bacterium]
MLDADVGPVHVTHDRTERDSLDYLAHPDAAAMDPVYEFLALTAGIRRDNPRLDRRLERTLAFSGQHE